jgi:hypothetical protein
MGKYFKLSIPGWVASLYIIIHNSVRIVGDFDFLVTRSQDLGWIKTVLDYIWENNLIVSIIILFTGLIWVKIVMGAGKKDKRKQEIEKNKTQKKPLLIEWNVHIEPQELQVINFSKALIEVTLEGGDTAKNCLMQLDKLLEFSTKAPIEEFSPIILKWDGYSERDREVPLDIRNGQTRRVALCASPQRKLDKTPGEPGLHIIWTSNVFPNTKLNYPPGDYLARAKLTGDNIIPSVSQWFKISVGNEANTLKVEKSTTPVEPELIVEYNENDPKYYQKTLGEQLCRISIENTIDKTIDDVSIELTNMEPPHSVFEYILPMTLKEPNYINPGKIFIDLIKWKWNGALKLYTIFGREFIADDEGHEIVITIRGKDMHPISKKYKFWSPFTKGKGNTLYLKLID